MNRNRTLSLAVVLVLAVVGCIKLPGIDPEVEPEEEPLPDLGVSLRTPAATTYTNGAVDLSVEVTNGTPEAVELFAGDELIATLTRNPYTFRWDTTSKPEGIYTLTAKARRGEQMFPSGARTVVVDRTPPQVVLRTPAPGEQYASVSQPIRTVFAEAIRRDSISNMAVRLSSGNGEIRVARVLSEDGKTLTMTPEVPFELESTLTLDITGGPADLAGNSAIEPAGGWSWRVPTLIPVGPALSAHPETRKTGGGVIQVDAEGRLLAAWSEFDGVANNIYVRRWSGESWEAIGGALSANPGQTNTESPCLRVDAQGNPIVAWIEISDEGFNVHVWRWNGSSWDALGGALSAYPGFTPARSPFLLLDKAGRPVIAWEEGDGGSVANVFVQRWNGNSWESICDPFDPTPGGYREPLSSVVLDDGDSPVVAWRQYVDGTFLKSSIHVYRWSGTAWVSLGGVLKANAANSHAALPVLYSEPRQGLFVVWVETDKNIYLRRWGGGSWLPIGTPSEFAPSVGMLTLSLVMKQGRPVIAGLGSTNGIANAHVWQWTGSAFEKIGGALAANPEETGVLVHMSLQLDAEACPFVAWSEREGAGHPLYVFGCNR